MGEVGGGEASSGWDLRGCLCLKYMKSHFIDSISQQSHAQVRKELPVTHLHHLNVLLNVLIIREHY